MVPFLDPYNNTAPNIEGTQKGTIIWTTTHMQACEAQAISATAWHVLKLFMPGPPGQISGWPTLKSCVPAATDAWPHGVRSAVVGATPPPKYYCNIGLGFRV